MEYQPVPLSTLTPLTMHNEHTVGTNAQGEQGLSIGSSFKFVLPTSPQPDAPAPTAGQWRQYMW